MNFIPERSTCNTNNCKFCQRKYGCVKYLSYLEDIATAPLSVATDTKSIINNTLPRERGDMFKLDFNVLEDIKTTIRQNVNLSSVLSELEGIRNMLNTMSVKQEALEEQTNYVVEFLDRFNTPENTTTQEYPDGKDLLQNTDLVIPTSDETKEETIYVEKKGFFGLGKTKWVEEKVK